MEILLEWMKGSVLLLTGVMLLFVVKDYQKDEDRIANIDHKIGQCFDQNFDGKNLNVENFQVCVKP